MTTLVERGFVSDPVKAWKTKVAKDTAPDDESEAPVTDFASSTSTTSGGPDFQYLLTMAIMSLSKERKDELLRQRDQKVIFLFDLRKSCPCSNQVKQIRMYNARRWTTINQENVSKQKLTCWYGVQVVRFYVIHCE